MRTIYRNLVDGVIAAVLVTAAVLPMPLSAQMAKSPVAPRRELVEQVVREAYEKFKSDSSGKNADYIPYLAQVDSKLFGIAIVLPIFVSADCTVLGTTLVCLPFSHLPTHRIHRHTALKACQAIT